MRNSEITHNIYVGLRNGWKHKLIAKKVGCSIHAVGHAARKRPTRVLLPGDYHCGSYVGLTPPEYQFQYISNPTTEEHRKRNKWALLQKECWDWYIHTLEMLKPIDKCFVMGDLIDGDGSRSGGTELITTDRNKQSCMAIEAIEPIGANYYSFVYGCLTAGHRVLTSDLRYIPVETLKKGDTLLAFEENPKISKHRHWVKSTVTANVPVKKMVYKIYLSDGTKLETSADHPFLIKAPSRKPRWRTTEDLYKLLYYESEDNHYSKRQQKKYPTGKRNEVPFIHFRRTLPVWKTDNSFDAGYLAGFFDGEGSCCQTIKSRRFGWEERSLRITASQKDNACLKQVKISLKNLGIPFKTYTGYKNKPGLFNLSLLGGTGNGIEFLGRIRPPRLLDKFDINKLGTLLRRSKPDDTKIIDIKPLGVQEVWGLGTTSRTYIAEGFLCHNTSYHTGNAEDFEANISKHFDSKIGSHEWEEVNGIIFDLKHHQGTTRNPATSLYNEVVDNREWAVLNEQPKADVLVRAHSHRFCILQMEDCMAISIPSLQAYGTKFGSRRCSRKVQFGLVALDVWPDGEITVHKKIAKLAGHKTNTN